MTICHHMLTSSTQLQNRSFHVVERTRTSAKMSKNEKCTFKACKTTVFHRKYENLSRFCCSRRRGCLSSGVSKTQTTDLENADLEKRNKRRTKGLKFITLASKGCFCVCDTSVFSRSLFARSAFSRSACVFEVCGLRFRDTRLSFPVSLGGARNIFMPSNCESRGKSIIFNGAEFFPQM